MPGCLGLDGLWQLLGFYLGWSGYQGKGRALGSGKVKFTGQILPGVKKVRYHLNIQKIVKLSTVMGIATGYVYADDDKVYTASELKVGLFTDL